MSHIVIAKLHFKNGDNKQKFLASPEGLVTIMTLQQGADIPSTN